MLLNKDQVVWGAWGTAWAMGEFWGCDPGHGEPWECDLGKKQVRVRSISAPGL